MILESLNVLGFVRIPAEYCEEHYSIIRNVVLWWNKVLNLSNVTTLKRITVHFKWQVLT